MDRTLGVVGKVIEGMYLKIDPETKEILISGPLVMKEYYKSPELTSKVIKDGWMHTGDTGKMDEKGYLHLEGRKSDTFKTAKGKFLAPMAIESLMDNDENIEMLIIIGIGVPQPMALIRLSEVGLTKGEEQIKTELLKLLGNVNSKLLNYQRLSKIIIVEDEWNMDNKMLTPTLKIRRNEIDGKYRKEYLKWFEQPEVIILGESNRTLK